MFVCAVVTTVAGSGTSAFADGVGTAASFMAGVNAWSCTGIFVTSVGDIMVMEYGAHRIRMVATSGIFTVFKQCLYWCHLSRCFDHCSGLVSTVAGSGTAGWLDGVGTSTQFNKPIAGFGDAMGNLFVVDNGSHRIRMIASAGLKYISNAFPCILLMLFMAIFRSGDYHRWVWS